MKFVSKLFFITRLLSVAIIFGILIDGAVSDGMFDKFSIDISSLFNKGHGNSAGFVRSKAFIEESPEIGLGFHKIPIILPIPSLIFRKSKHIVSKGVSMPVESYGGGYDGGYGGGYGGGYDGY